MRELQSSCNHAAIMPPRRPGGTARGSLLHALVSSRTVKHCQPLHLCASPVTVRVLSCLCHADREGCNTNGETPLMMATFDKNIPVVEEMLRHGANVNAKDSGGITAVIGAALSEHQVLVRILLEAGANIHIATPSAFTVMYAVCCYADARMLKMVLEWGADPTGAYAGEDMPTVIRKRNRRKPAEKTAMLQLLQAAGVPGACNKTRASS